MGVLGIILAILVIVGYYGFCISVIIFLIKSKEYLLAWGITMLIISSIGYALIRG